jgi:hypothetical protein
MSDIVDTLIDNKFEVKQLGNTFNKTNGWFGNNVYHTDTKFIKDNKMAIIGIGMLGNHYYYLESTRGSIMDETLNIDTFRYIVLLKDNNIIYRSNTGIVPNETLLLNYINS